MKACDYCICWFCSLRKECPKVGNRCKAEGKPHCKNAIVAKDFECPDAEFGDK